MNKDKIKKDIEEIETINIEWEHRVSKLIVENEHLKQAYKQLYDSIKPTRIRSKEQCDALINQVNQKSMEISDLNVSLQEKGLVITTLKDELRKLKGKDLADNIVTKHTIAPEMLKFDMETITPKLLNNRTSHSDYLRHTQEQAAILREVVEQGKSQKPLNNSLDSTCNTKKDKIQRTPSSTQKNIVEAYLRAVKSSLKNKNYVVEPKGTANVQHSKLNANYELLCDKCIHSLDLEQKVDAMMRDVLERVLSLFAPSRSNGVGSKRYHVVPYGELDVIKEYLVKVNKRRAFWSLNEDILKINDSDYQYAVSIKEDTAYPCLYSPKTTKETRSIRRIQRRPIRRIEDME
ncbi:hypothetical protein Tco_0933972 [Tanacetum coccineum]